MLDRGEGLDLREAMMVPGDGESPPTQPDDIAATGRTVDIRHTTTYSQPAPFLVKTFDMVDDTSTDHIVSWTETGKSFVVWNIGELSKDVLPKYFKHNNFSSFVRQLNTYVRSITRSHCQWGRR